MLGSLPVALILTLTCQTVRSDIFANGERKPLQGNRPPPGSPWPMPKHWKFSDVPVTFTPERLALSSNVKGCDLVDEAFKRLIQRLTSAQSYNSLDSQAENNGRRGSTPESAGKKEVKVHVHDGVCPRYPQFGVTEDYTLEVDDTVNMTASSVWGVIWGLETLGQLMYMVDGMWYINKTTIVDEPRFKHRGLHLDTARHFYGVDVLKKNLEAMSTNKFNVFHWHLVDSQSFPYESITFPELARQGAFSARHIYSQKDIQEIIEYARLHGIRVLPEFDSPGHAYSWGKAMPELLTLCWANGKPDQAIYNLHAHRENFDPSKNFTFQFLQRFFQEIKGVFADEFIHLGMDEALYYCWQSNPDIAKFMSSVGLAPDDYTGLEQYYDERLLGIVHGLDKRTVIWEDPLNNGAKISNGTLIQLWKDYEQLPEKFKPWSVYLKDALQAGYDVIFSSCWYLNFIHYGQDWKTFYTCDPFNITATEEELARIVGGEACTWSEYIDENNVLQIMWPRAAAVAERLWSRANVINTDDAAFRLDQHRCRLVRQGIPAVPISPGFCHDDYNTDNAIIMRQHLPTTAMTTDNPTTPATRRPDDIIIG